MKDSNVTPTRTYALVVGIEKYDLGSGADLNGPAHDARRFADWLSARGVPPENIALLLSPLDRNHSLLDEWPGQYKWPATRERVDNAVYRWLGERSGGSGDLLYVFWGGHGIMASTPTWSRRLFYADTTNKNWDNLMLESLLDYMRSSKCSDFQQQICLIDTCADYKRELSQEDLGYGIMFPPGAPVRHRKQFVFFATREGEVAKNLSQEQTGLFSKIVLEELAKEEPPTLCPPDMERLAERMQKYFETLPEKPRMKQTPIFASYRAGDGTQRTIIQIEPERRCDSYAHIFLPPNYVAREEVVAKVRDVLLGEVPTTELTSQVSSIPDALHGIGGIGKTVIARGLCDDPAMQLAFPDGILWATLGQKPELVSEMRRWVQVLGGTISENAPTVDSLKNLLAKLLKDRICLLILDDVWRRSHAEAFFVGGPRCRMLLTARDAEIAGELGAMVQPIPGMTEAEAITLLEGWSDGHLTGTDLILEGQIVKRLGYLPLAVKLAGAQLRRKQAEEWLKLFDIRKLKSSRPEGIHDDLELTFNLSLDELNEVDRRLYVSLAIFKEDEATPQVGIERLWHSLDNFDATSTTDLLDDLAARALLDVTSLGSSRVVRLHVLLHDLIDMELNGKRTGRHQALLRAYRVMCKGDGWHTVDDDGYLYDHLTYHLHATGAMEELKGLFVDQGQLHKRVSQRDYIYDGYLKDLSLIWEQASAETRRQIETNREPTGFADCMRYLLIQTSINSIAGNLSPELVARAVEVGLWTVQRALSVAAKVPIGLKQTEKIEMYVAILKTGRLNKEQQEEVHNLGLKTALTLKPKRARAEALAALAPYLTGDQRTQALTQALEAALALEGENMSTRAEVLAALAPYLTGDQRAQALKQTLKATLALEDENMWIGTRAEVLIALAPQLTGALLQEALEAALTPEEVFKRAEVLIALAPQLTGALLEQALEAALALRFEWDRARVLAVLAPRLTGEQRTQVVVHELTFKQQKARAGVLVALVPYLAGEQRAQVMEQTLKATLALERGWTRAKVLIALAPHLAGEQRTQVLELALEAALTLKGEMERAEVLIALAPQLTGALLEQALEAALALRFEWDRARVLAVLAPRLTEALLQRALQAALTIEDEWERAEMLTALASRLNAEQRVRALEQSLKVALAIEKEWQRAETLAALASQLTGERRVWALEQALEATLAINVPMVRAWVLKALAPQLVEERRAQVLEQTFRESLRFEPECIKVLIALGPQLTGTLLEEALKVALALKSKGERAEVLAVLAPQLTGEQRAQVVKQALEAALALENESIQTKDPKPRRRRTIFLSPALENERTQIKVLIALAPMLGGKLLDQALGHAQTFKSKRARAEVLAALVPYLTGERRTQALEQGLEAAQAIKVEKMKAPVEVSLPALAVKGENMKIRAEVLAALVPFLTGERRTQALEQGLEAAQAIKDKKARVEALAKLGPLVRDQATLLRSIRMELVDELSFLKTSSRKDVFRQFCARQPVITSIFSSETLGTIASHIIEICEEWHWL